MIEITDEYMRSMLATSRGYVAVILKAGPKYGSEDAPAIIWEHGRRNFALRAEGRLAIVCPVPDDSEVCGIGIFDGELDDVRTIMDGDPGVQAGTFTYEMHPCRSFPGDALPASSDV
jgi:hypothetical protein